MTYLRKDGFEGQKLISLPQSVYRNANRTNPLLNQLFITHIGYFPKADYHYRERTIGCNDNILIYCLSGKGWYIIDNKKYNVGPNQFVHLPATSKHMIYGAEEEEPWTIYWVHYCGKDLETFNKSLNIKEHNGVKDIAYNEKAIEIWDDMYQSLEMGYSNDNLCNANLCLYHFLATFFYPEKHLKSLEEKENDFIDSTIYFMRDNIQKRMSVEELASLNNLSTSHFSLLFRKATGWPPGDYFIQLKMQKACQMLYDPKMKIKEISYGLGYDDQHYFSRLFKKIMGVSPEQYRLLTTK